MLVFTTIDSLQTQLNKERGTIGFVPTMGALHDGHISLISSSLDQSDFTVCSIFVNPIQFNKTSDFENYPVTLEMDKEKLEAVGCHALFLPSFEEMYPTGKGKSFDFGQLSSVMEGAYRPGHFDGVASVIERFFDIIEPDFAFFGEKDFQQLAVVSKLVENSGIKTSVVGCPIVREKNGLAMSSRNQRLSKVEKEVASEIYKGLLDMKSNFRNISVEGAKSSYIAWIDAHEIMEVEYIEIVDGKSLMPIKKWEDTTICMAFTAININGVRLIDNLTLFK